jgi:signal transduction histidine kinase
MEHASDLVIGILAFSLLAALLAYFRLTRRLRALAAAVNRFRDGDFTRPIRLASAHAADDSIDHLSATIEQMSERIARQLEQLQHAQTWRLELLADVSHDLRTPLASMQGYLELLLLKHGAMPLDEQRSYLEIATRHGERLDKLIRDLFQLSKLEAHEMTPRCEAFSVAELVQDLVQKFQLAAEKRGIRLDCRLCGHPVRVLGDIAMIETVLENLVENAMRHTPAGGNVDVEVEPRAGRVAVRVADTGCGIASEDVAKLFDRYYRVDRAAAGHDGGGTGLGLAIVRRIIELHGSTISVESTLGQGSKFGFDLEIAADVAVARHTVSITPAAPR